MERSTVILRPIAGERHVGVRFSTTLQIPMLPSVGNSSTIPGRQENDTQRDVIAFPIPDSHFGVSRHAMTPQHGTASPLSLKPVGRPLTGGNEKAAGQGWARKFSGAVVLLYLLAFILPVIDNVSVLERANNLGFRPQGCLYGWQAFLFGFFVKRTAWFANVAIWAGIVLLFKRKPLPAAAAGAVALGLGSMYLGVLADHSLLSPRAFSAGYFCWLDSAVLLTGAGLGFGLFGYRRGSLVFAASTGATGLVVLVAIAHLIIATTAPPSEAALADRLLSGDAAARRAAARKLAVDHNAGLIPAFIQAISDPDDKVRQYAIGALGDIGPAAAAAAPALIGVLHRPLLGASSGHVDSKRSANSRSAAAAALGKIGPMAKEAVPALAAALKDENIPVRRWSATSLGEMGAAGRSAVPALLAALGDSDVQVRRYAVESLKKIGPNADAIPILSNSLQDSDTAVREMAAALLKTLRESPGARAGNR